MAERKGEPMDNREAVNWLINISADIGKAEHSDLWHYEQALTEIKDMLESAQPEKRTEKRTETHACDLIDRQAAIDALWKALYEYEDKTEKQFQESEDLDIGDWIEHRIFVQNMSDIDRKTIMELPSAQPEQRWIPFKTRPLTKEEKEEHPEWDGILDCKLPDDGQRILVNVSVRGHESVQYDEFYTDDGSYLDSGYEIGTEATAWMPLPEPYRGGIQ